MMHYRNLLITIHFFVAAITCNAMENKPISTTPKILTTLTNAGFPHGMICLKNNIIATTRQTTCNLWNISTKKKRALNDYTVTSQYPFIASDSNKEILAIAQYKKLTLYNGTQNVKIKEMNLKNDAYGWVFDSDNIILMLKIRNGLLKIKSFDYINDSRKSYNTEYNIHSNVIIAKNPPSKEITLFDNYYGGTIIIGFNDTDTVAIKKISKPTQISFATYSPDGSLIALIKENSTYYWQQCHIHQGGFYILNVASGTFSKLLSSDDQRVSAIKFHPTSFILATFSYANYTINYWNSKTQELIVTTPLNVKPSQFDPQSSNQFIDFSPDGTKLIVDTPNNLLEIEVPFEALYQSNTADKCISALGALKHYRHENDALPNEIKHLLVQYLFAASKYSFTNY